METGSIKQDFIDYLKDHLLDHLPEDIAAKATVSIEEVIKGNDLRLTVVMISENDSNITPTIYVDGQIKEAQNGKEFSYLAQNIANRFMEARAVGFDDFDLNRVGDFNEVKNRLVTKIINRDMSRDYLSDIPYRQFGDLAIITQIKLDSSKESQASITIRDDMLKRWDVSFDDVIDIATKNDLEYSNPRLYPMKDVLSSMMFGEDLEQESFLPDHMDQDSPMYVFGTEEKIHGSKLLNQPELLDRIASFLESDLIVLPSSIHELIILPDNGTVTFNEEQLCSMISEINSTEVSPDDILSSHPMHYLKDEKVLFFEKDGEKINMLFTRKDKDRVSIKDRLETGRQKSSETKSESRKIVKEAAR